MALCWVICDVIGNGSPPRSNQTEATGPFRPAVDGLGPYRCLIVDGGAWCLVLIDGDAAAIDALPRTIVFPDERLDSTLTAGRAILWNIVLNRRTDIAFRASAGMTVRHVIESIAHELDPTFSTDWYPGVA
jgi:hypothetical protein